MPSSKGRRRHGGVRRVPPPTAEQVDLLADAMPSETLRAFTLVAAWSGLRLECEVARLLREDVALETVQRSVSPADGSGPAARGIGGGVHPNLAAVPSRALLHVRAGKGGKERRSVLFEPGLSALLEVGHESGHVFRNSRGLPWTRKAVNKVWVKARARVGLEHVVFHDLRKFHATWLLDRGVSDLDVAIQLGHFDRFGRPDAELVRRVYGWPDPMLGLARVAAAGGASVAA